ncbi:MAG: IMP dehydrogenase, partial [Planctomycetota bacterium]
MGTLTDSAARSRPADVAGSASRSQDTGPFSKITLEGITFDDVLLLPRRSSVTPRDADTTTRLTTRIGLGIPLISAPMDTVTESALAIALAQEGGIGVIHKNLPIDAQAREVAKVKRSANGVIADPITLGPGDTVARAVQLMRQHNVSGFPITEGGHNSERQSPSDRGKVVGILTRRDLKFGVAETTPVRDVMTATGLVSAPPGTTLAEAEGILTRSKDENQLLDLA